MARPGASGRRAAGLRFVSKTALPLALTLFLGPATSSMAVPTLAEETEKRNERTRTRLEALEQARRQGTLGIIEPVRRRRAPGWAGCCGCARGRRLAAAARGGALASAAAWQTRSR